MYAVFNAITDVMVKVPVLQRSSSLHGNVLKLLSSSVHVLQRVMGQ